MPETLPFVDARAVASGVHALVPREIGPRTFDFAREVAVMAIVNRTPDSFFDQGRTFALDAAISTALEAVENGADLIDIGGANFAPGEPIPVADEIERVVPVIEGMRGSGAVISVDTFHPEVAAAAITAGAQVINDTTGLHDPRMADVVADAGATIVITHSLAAPRTPYPAPEYGDVVAEVVDFLTARIDLAVSRGVAPERIIVDPGHDLNKNTLHSLELTRRFGEIAGLGFPTLAAISNKDFIGETLGREKDARLSGSLAALVFCIVQGARIVRMHDVVAAVDAARMTEAMLGFRSPAWLRHNMP